MKSRPWIGWALATGLIACGAQAELYKFVVPLEGAQEAPGPGDPDGSGTAVLIIDSTALSIDWEITVDGILLPPTGAHIHNAPFGVAGPVRVDFSAQLSGSGLVDADLAGVLANPANWYVNVHTTEFRAGAIRGQLTEPIVVPEASTWLAGGALSALGWLGYRRRRQSVTPS
ncbi:MAG: CHRD domain-containing protein [Verrucomicrobiales bacterium]|nr:CHRD domain-containing protein [Verrucomicrobiales bacterium]